MKSLPKSLILSFLISMSGYFVPNNLWAQSEETVASADSTATDDEAEDWTFFEQQEDADVGTSDKKAKSKKSVLFGMRWLNTPDLIVLLVRFLANMFFILIIVRMIYYPGARRKDFLFTYLLIGFTVFLLCFMLDSVKLEIGFALGLFAIFGIIRYRTDAIPIKEMTYLFIVIGISVMNALVNKKISIAEMVFANMALVAATYGLEKVWLLRHEQMKIVIYDRIDLIQLGRREELIQDLQARTGIKLNRIEIGKIDFLRDVAQVHLYFYTDEQPGHRDESMDRG
jgi:hypothetical protein